MKSKSAAVEKTNENQHLYDEVSEGARFREQYRLVFAATIVATFYVAPSSTVIDGYVKLVLGFAMFFAALYLICTAAAVKYQDRKFMYIVFYASNRVRMKSFDWAVDCFAVGFLGFLTLAAIGFVQTTFKIQMSNTLIGGLVAGSMLVIGCVIWLASSWLKCTDSSDKDTNKLI